MIERLVHIVLRKNDLNRRRRRFYYHRYVSKNSHITQTDAIAGYRKAQQDMKAMTPTMRILRKEIEAKFVWDDRGAIHAVIYQGVRIEEREFKRISNEYLADRILLGA